MKKDLVKTTDSIATEELVKDLQNKLNALIYAIFLVLFSVAVILPVVLLALGYDLMQQLLAFLTGLLILFITLLALKIFGYMD